MEAHKRSADLVSVLDTPHENSRGYRGGMSMVETTKPETRVYNFKSDLCHTIR